MLLRFLYWNLIGFQVLSFFVLCHTLRKHRLDRVRSLMYTVTSWVLAYFIYYAVKSVCLVLRFFPCLLLIPTCLRILSRCLLVSFMSQYFCHTFCICFLMIYLADYWCLLIECLFGQYVCIISSFNLCMGRYKNPIISQMIDWLNMFGLFSGYKLNFLRNFLKSVSLLRSLKKVF